MRIRGIYVAAAAMALFAGRASADVLLFDWGLNIDGDVSVPSLGDPIQAGVDVSGFDDSTGLGEISITITGAGMHDFASFFDHDIDGDVNTFFNEIGNTGGSPSAGQSWEIDEPGFVDGDIFFNFEGGAGDLDNDIGVSQFGDSFDPDGDDVSMALGWQFMLEADETATIDLFLSEQLDTAGFWLSIADTDSDAIVYFWGALTIEGPPPVGVPEPGSLALLGIGLLGFAAARRRRTA